MWHANQGRNHEQETKHHLDWCFHRFSSDSVARPSDWIARDNFQGVFAVLKLFVVLVLTIYVISARGRKEAVVVRE
jgi:hypothetical protein